MSKAEQLNIVNDDDEVIGAEDRAKIHKEGLLHRKLIFGFIHQNMN